MQHYNMRSPNSYIGNPLHDLNTVDARPAAEIDSISDVDRDAVTEHSLDNDDGSSAVVSDCIHESYTNSLPIHGVRVGVEEDRSRLENHGGSSSSRAPYDLLSLQGTNFNLLPSNFVYLCWKV